MKVTVFGSTGAIGSFVVQELLKNGRTVIAFARNASKVPSSWKSQVTLIIGELSDATKVKQAVAGSDVVVNAMGPSLEKNVTDFPLVLGTKNILNAMETHGIRRYIGHATPSIKDPEEPGSWKPPFLAFMARNIYHRAYTELLAYTALIMAAPVDWTIIRFTFPNDKPKMGSVVVGFYGQDNIGFRITRADIGAFTAAQVDDSRYIRRAPAVSN